MNFTNHSILIPTGILKLFSRKYFAWGLSISLLDEWKIIWDWRFIVYKKVMKCVFGGEKKPLLDGMFRLQSKGERHSRDKNYDSRTEKLLYMTFPA